jgi:hypothetical protein
MDAGLKGKLQLSLSQKFGYLKSLGYRKILARNVISKHLNSDRYALNFWTRKSKTGSGDSESFPSLSQEIYPKKI